MTGRVSSKIERIKWRLITRIFYKNKTGMMGKKTVIYKPLQIKNARSMIFGDSVKVHHYSWLLCVNNDQNGALTIMDNATIGHFAHLVAMKSVVIEKDVLIADKVFISDCTHQYEDIDIPVLKQDISFLAPVVIGEGSWLGENVCVCGAKIGKHCVIGANSVVISDIPDYCVAAGSPARIVKRYDLEKKEWVRP